MRKTLEDIKMMIVKNLACKNFEVEMVAMQLYMSFTTELEEEDIEDILLSD